MFFVSGEWTRLWKSSTPSKNYQGAPKIQLDQSIKDLPRFDSATIVQLRTGHGYFNSYLATKSTARKQIPSERCQCGYAQQTPEHLILHCSRYKEQRRHLHKAIRPLQETLLTTLHTTRGVAATVNFIKQTSVAKRPNILQWLWERRRREEGMEGD